MRRVCRLLSGAMLLLVLLLCCCGASALQRLEGMVRVRLSSLGMPQTLTVITRGEYTLNNRTIPSGRYVTFTMTGNTVKAQLDGQSIGTGSSLQLKRSSDQAGNGLILTGNNANGRLFPGSLTVSVSSENGATGLQAVLRIYMEDYLTGVLPWEMGEDAGIEALKAQAIAARSFTLSRMSVRSGYSYDVQDTVKDQVYLGTAEACTRCASAVQSTQGLVLMWRGSVAEALYTASNGGQTESAWNVWGSAGYDYLTVKDDPWDLANTLSPALSCLLPVNLTNDERIWSSLLENKVSEILGGDFSLRRVTGVRVHTPRYSAPSLLYTKLDCTLSVRKNSRDQSVTVTFDIFNELETVLGMSLNELNNELWTVNDTKDGYVLTARRYGHGVGMSQRGAMRMSDSGRSYQQILEFYYPGCTLSQVSLLNASGQSESEADTAQSGENAVVSTADGGVLNMRVQPDVTSDILTFIPNGARVTVLEENGKWCRIRYQSQTGYVMTGFLTIQTAAAQATARPAQTYAYVNTVTGGLNLRQTPSSDAAVVAIIPQYTIIPVYEQSDGWCRTSYGGVWGYVMSGYLLMSDGSSGFPSAAPTAAPTAVPSATPAPTTASTILSGQAVVSTGGQPLGLRVMPYDEAAVMMTIPDGSVVTIEDYGEAWSCVTWDEATGYVQTCFLTDASAAPQETGGIGTVTVRQSDGLLNLRAGASTDSEILAQLPGGTVLTLLEQGDTWCRVRYGSLTGWCMTAFLELTAQPSGIHETRAWIVTGLNGGVNLRVQPGYDKAVVTVLAGGVQVTVTGEQSGWYAVTCGTWQGYVLSDLVTFTQPVPEATAAPADPGQASGTTTRYVSTSSGTLNMRALPDGEAAIVLKIPRGSAVTLIVDQGEWSFISYNHTMGYVLSSLISKNPPAGSDSGAAADTGLSLYDPTLHEVSGQFGIVMPDEGIQLRMWCKDDAPAVCVIAAGSLVEIRETGDTWCKIYDGENEGYCLTATLGTI